MAKDMGTGGSNEFDVAVVGAGFAGLTCARALQQQGYSVVVLEKSRGVGGRAATRRISPDGDDRISPYPVDHGLPYLEIMGDRTQEQVKWLCQQDLVQPWAEATYLLDGAGNLQHSPVEGYIASQGMNAIAKCLAAELQILKQWQVSAIAPHAGKWVLRNEGATETILARILVLAIPAPQAVPLVQTLPEPPLDFLQQLQAVQYDPCIAVMAGCPSLVNAIDWASYQQRTPWQAVEFSEDPLLDRALLDSSKRSDTPFPVMVLHSTPTFAAEYLDSPDCTPAGQLLLQRAAELLQLPLTPPAWMQVHRWRYANVRRSLSVDCLRSDRPLPLIGCGDWCGGMVEGAFASGIAAASIVRDWH